MEDWVLAAFFFLCRLLVSTFLFALLLIPPLFAGLIGGAIGGAFNNAGNAILLLIGLAMWIATLVLMWWMIFWAARHTFDFVLDRPHQKLYGFIGSEWSPFGPFPGG